MLETLHASRHQPPRAATHVHVLIPARQSLGVVGNDIGNDIGNSVQRCRISLDRFHDQGRLEDVDVRFGKTMPVRDHRLVHRLTEVGPQVEPVSHLNGLWRTFPCPF